MSDHEPDAKSRLVPAPCDEGQRVADAACQLWRDARTEVAADLPLSKYVDQVSPGQQGPDAALALFAAKMLAILGQPQSDEADETK